MKNHPETVNAPIISTAVTSILVDLFKDELERGKREYRDGTGQGYEKTASRALVHLKAQAARGRMTFTDLLLAQTFEVASKTDPSDLRRLLTSLGATVVQWMEHLDRTHGGV